MSSVLFVWPGHSLVMSGADGQLYIKLSILQAKSSPEAHLADLKTHGAAQGR
jgi:hypothetical protein